jgi:hypothetical protein
LFVPADGVTWFDWLLAVKHSKYRYALYVDIPAEDAIVVDARIAPMSQQSIRIDSRLNGNSIAIENFSIRPKDHTSLDIAAEIAANATPLTSNPVGDENQYVGHFSVAVVGNRLNVAANTRGHLTIGMLSVLKTYGDPYMGRHGKEHSGHPFLRKLADMRIAESYSRVISAALCNPRLIIKDVGAKWSSTESVLRSAARVLREYVQRLNVVDPQAPPAAVNAGLMASVRSALIFKNYPPLLDRLYRLPPRDDEHGIHRIDLDIDGLFRYIAIRPYHEEYDRAYWDSNRSSDTSSSGYFSPEWAAWARLVTEECSALPESERSRTWIADMLGSAGNVARAVTLLDRKRHQPAEGPPLLYNEYADLASKWVISLAIASVDMLAVDSVLRTTRPPLIHNTHDAIFSLHVKGYWKPSHSFSSDITLLHDVHYYLGDIAKGSVEGHFVSCVGSMFHPIPGYYRLPFNEGIYSVDSGVVSMTTRGAGRSYEHPLVEIDVVTGSTSLGWFTSFSSFL